TQLIQSATIQFRHMKAINDDLHTLAKHLFCCVHQKRREAPAFMPGRDRRWARWAQCPRAQQDSRSTRALNGRGNCREGSPGIHAGEDVPDKISTAWAGSR